MKKHQLLTYMKRCITVMAILLSGQSSFAQMDSITYNSTCSNYKIEFNSSVFNTIEFPDRISWNFGDPSSGFYNTATTQTPTHAFNATGAYDISVTVFSGGDSVTLKDTINIVSPMVYHFGPDIYLCSHVDTTLIAPIVPNATYEWNDDSLTKTNFLKVTKTGIYTVLINGCAVSDSIGVYYSDTPRIDLGDDHILCAGEILTLNAASQNGIYTWKLNGNILPDSLGQLPVINPGGHYVVSVNVPGCGLYADSVNITFSSLPAPAFSLGVDTLLCPKQLYTLTASVAGATAYRWSTGATSNSIQVTQQGLYWAFVKVNNQCEVVDTAEVDYRDDKTLDFHDTAICQGTTLILDADFGTGTYNWVADPPQRNDQDQTDQATYYVYNPGLYKVIAAIGNCMYTDSIRVSVNDSLILNIGRDTSLCIDEAYVLHVQTNANSFAWQDGSPAYDYPVKTTGVYSVIGQNGCGVDTATVKIDFRHCECDLTLPNAFTPNGDGLNETFRPLHPCDMSDYNIKIFNRYGQLIFESANPSTGWDGTFKGAKAVDGTYVWMSSYTNTNNNQRQFKKGTLLLVR